MDCVNATEGSEDPLGLAHTEFLRQSERMEDIVIVAGPCERIRFVNSAFEKLTGFRREDVLGQHAYDLAAPGHGGLRFDRLRQVLHQDTAWFGAYRLVARNGVTPWLSAQVGACRDRTGRLSHYLALHRPALRRRREDAHLAQVSRLENLGLLTSSIAHDLNNTITPILGYASMLAAGHDRARPDVYGRAISSAAARARELISRVLSASQHRTDAFRNVPLDEISLDVLRLIVPTVSRHIQVRTDLAESCEVNGEPGLLYTLILNLVVNAAQAMPNGGVLEVQTTQVQGDGRPDHFGRPILGPKAVLVVRDTGCGMTSEVLARIFERFFTTKKRGGTGLGMYVVRRVLEQHEGQILVRTAPGQGTQFQVYLPLHDAPHAPAAIGKEAGLILH